MSLRHRVPSRRTVPRALRLLLATVSSLALVAAAAVGLSAPAHAVSSDVVIAQVYGGGGNSGAQFKNDFVQLFNGSAARPSTCPAGRSRYFSASGTGRRARRPSPARIAARHAYLVQVAAGTTPSGDLPTPDAVGVDRDVRGTAGRIDLDHRVGDARRPRGLRRTATTFEGSGRGARRRRTPLPTCASRPAPTPTRTPPTSPPRAPAPENSATAAPACALPPPVTGRPATIEQIQGAAHISPLKGHSWSTSPAW